MSGYPKNWVTPRGPTGHGSPANSTSRENPTVHSKATRRYGHDGGKAAFPHSSTGHQPTKPDAQEFSGPAAAVGLQPGKPVSKTVGHAPDGSGRFIEPTHPNTGKHTGGVKK